MSWKLIVAVSLVLAPPASAQGRAPGAGGRAAQLRERVEETFIQRARQQLGLTAEQTEQMMTVVRTNGAARHAMEDEERMLRDALARELRPGVAARPDSVNRYVERISRNRIEYAQSFHKELQDLQPILSPAQRGLYLQMRDQLLQRVRELQQARPDGAPPGPTRRP